MPSGAIGFEKAVQRPGECDNCTVYPVDEDVAEHMPSGLDIHGAAIVATGPVHKGAAGDVDILTEDEALRASGTLPVA
jgi:hypothetical protein